MAETLRIEESGEARNETEPVLTGSIRNFTKVKTAAEQAGTASQEAGDQVSKFDRSAEKVQKTLSGWMKEKYEVALKAADFVTAPVKGILNLLKDPVLQAGEVLGVSFGLADTMDAFRGFEAAMSQVEVISGAAASDMGRLTDKARELGATTKFTAAESAEALHSMAMAGWEAGDMLDAMEGIFSLAAASGTDLAQASDLVADVLSDFGMKADEAGHFADVLAAASSKSGTNVALLTETFKAAGAMAGMLGYSIEDVALAAGLMAGAQSSGSQSGAALNSVFTRLSTNVNGAADALNDLGIAYFNTDGSARAFGNIIQELRDATADYTDEQKANLANTVAGADAQKEFLAILDATAEDYEKLSSAVNHADGAAGEAAESMMDNLDGSITLLQGAVDNVKLSFGERFAPYFRGIAEWLTDAMPMVEEALESLMDFVDRHVDTARRKLDDLVNSERWQDTDFFGKVEILWDGIIAEPFGKWWNSTGKAKIAEIIGDIGSGLGAGLGMGIITLPGIDVSGILDEGASIGASFARGFSEGFDVSAITSKLGKVFQNLFASAGKLLPGGESADLSSLLSAALLMKLARQVMGMGKALLGSSVGQSLVTSLTGATGNAMVRGSGLLGMLANVGYGLSGGSSTAGMYFGNMAGAMSGSSAALLGAGATAGGIAAGSAIISGGIDFYKALKSEDEEEAAAYGESGAWKITGVGTGALAGASIGAMFGGVMAVPGALIGAGIGGIAGWIKGNKVKEEYQEHVEEMEQQAQKARKVFEATGLDIKNVTFREKELQKAIEDTEVTTEQFAQYFQESCAEVMKNAFGDLKLSLMEVKELAKTLTFGSMAEGMEQFGAAAEAAEESFAFLEHAKSVLAKQNWNASLGLELSVEDQEDYQAAIDSFVASARSYLKDSHYEAVNALGLLTGGADTTGVDAMYTGYEAQVDELQEELRRVFSESLGDGVISTRDKITVKIDGMEMEMSEADAITELQGQIAGITDKVSQAEENAGLESLKIKYEGAALSIDSFAQLQTELQASTAQFQQSYDDALEVSLKNLDQAQQEGTIKQEEYDSLYSQIKEGYNSQIEALTARVEEFQFDAIVSAYSDKLDGILPDMEGNMTEKLTQVMEQALAAEPDVSAWGNDFITDMFNLEGLEGEVQQNLIQLLKMTAATIPTSYTTALHENLLNTDLLSEAGTAYGAAMNTGLKEEILAGGPQLRSSAERAVQSAFRTPFDVTAEVNIRPEFKLPPVITRFLESSFQERGGGSGSGSGSGSGRGSGSADAGGGEEPTNPGGRNNVTPGPNPARLSGGDHRTSGAPGGSGYGSNGLELYGQDRQSSGISSYTGSGFTGYDIPVPDGSSEDTQEIWDSREGVPEEQSSAAGVQVSVDIAMSPEFHISGAEGQKEGDMLQSIRQHLRELADEVGGEIAERLSEVFGNMPLKGQ